MKFADKYALLPIDRYNQLIKRGSINRDSGFITSEKQEGSGLRGELTHKPSESEQKKPQPEKGVELIDEHSTTPDKQPTLETTSQPERTTSESPLIHKEPFSGEYMKNDQLEKPNTRKKVKKPKYPRLPPGTPNTQTKKNIGWVRLF